MLNRAADTTAPLVTETDDTQLIQSAQPVGTISDEMKNTEDLEGFFSPLALQALQENILTAAQIKEFAPIDTVNDPFEFARKNSLNILKNIFTEGGLIALRRGYLTLDVIRQRSTATVHNIALLVSEIGIKAFEDGRIIIESSENSILEDWQILRADIIRSDLGTDTIISSALPAFLLPNSKKALEQKLLQRSDFNIIKPVLLTPLMSDNGLIALAKKYITITDLSKLTLDKLELLLSDNGLLAFEKKILTAADAGELSLTLLEVILTEAGIKVLLHVPRLITLDEIKNAKDKSSIGVYFASAFNDSNKGEITFAQWSLFSNLEVLHVLNSEDGCIAKAEGLISCETAQLFKMPKILELLVSPNGRIAMAHGLISPEVVIKRKLNPSQLGLLLKPSGLIALSKGIGIPEEVTEASVTNLKWEITRANLKQDVRHLADINKTFLPELVLSENDINEIKQEEKTCCDQAIGKCIAAFAKQMESQYSIDYIKPVLQHLDDMYVFHGCYFPAHFGMRYQEVAVFKIQMLEKIFACLIENEAVRNKPSYHDVVKIDYLKAAYLEAVKQSLADPELSNLAVNALKKHVETSALLQFSHTNVKTAFFSSAPLAVFNNVNKEIANADKELDTLQLTHTA